MSFLFSPPYMPGLDEKQEKIRNLAYRVALGSLIVCPAIIAVPPRKLDFYTFGLGLTWVYCLNHVFYEQDVDLLKSVVLRQRVSPHQPITPTELKKEFDRDDDLLPSEYIMKTIKDVWNQEPGDDKRDAERWEKFKTQKELTEGNKPGVAESLSVLNEVRKFADKRLEEDMKTLSTEEASSGEKPSQPLIQLPKRHQTHTSDEKDERNETEEKQSPWWKIW